MRRVRPVWAVAIAALIGGVLALHDQETSPVVDARTEDAPTRRDRVPTAPPAESVPRARPGSDIDDRALREAIAERAGDRWVEGAGVVVNVLPDDRRGSRHQRFVLGLPDGATVLVAHNIDLAPRIDGLREGDRVAFRGEFEWNERGGVVHWTHRDPQGRREGGWLRHAGRTYR